MSNLVFLSSEKVSQLKVSNVDYIEYWVGNAKICSQFYANSFGFSPIAIKGLETGEKTRSSHVLVQGRARFVFTSTLRRNDDEFNNHLSIHGDAVRDVALSVSNVHEIYQQAITKGAKSVQEPHEITDENGTVVFAKIAAPFGDLIHTLLDRSRYNGIFLPGYKPIESKQPVSGYGVTHIDHIAVAYENGKVQEALNWYSSCLGFVQFLCNDEDTSTGLTVMGMDGGLRTIVAASSMEQYSLKFVFVEALQAKNGKQNQIAEYLEFNGGKSGVHHIALHTDNITQSVTKMKSQGVEFITVPSLYYEELFAKEGYFMKEEQQTLQQLGILMDITHKANKSTPNFLFQTFTVPIQDRPTFFFEIISRKGSNGFGDRTIKALFEAIERLQEKRSVA